VNERIKQLYEQAHERKPTMRTSPVTWQPVPALGHDGVPMYSNEFNPDMFAELILEEVAIVAANLSNYYSKKLLYAETDAERDLEHRAGAACIHVMVDVKKHFGQDHNDIRRYFDKPAELNK
jgi:hypothetical protein